MTSDGPREISRNPRQLAPKPPFSNPPADYPANVDECVDAASARRSSQRNTALSTGPATTPSHIPSLAHTQATARPDPYGDPNTHAHSNSQPLRMIDTPTHTHPDSTPNHPSPVITLSRTSAMEYSAPDVHASVPPAALRDMTVPPSSLSLNDEHKLGEPARFMSDFLRSVMNGDFSSDGVNMSFRGATYFLPDAELQPFLENLNFVKVVKTDPQMIGDLLRSSSPLVKTPRRVKLHNNACELQRRGFVSWATVKSLGVDWDAVPLSITPMGYGIQHVHVHEPELSGSIRGLHEDNPMAYRLRDHLSSAPDTEVMVLKHRSDHCVIVAREDNPWQGYAITGAPL